MKKLLFAFIGTATLLFINGCIYTTQDVTLEARFLETKQPATGSLFYYHPVISFSVPRFDPVVSSNGTFEIKVVNKIMFCDFRLPTHNVSPYWFSVSLRKKEMVNWDQPTTSNWYLMQTPDAHSTSLQADYPEIEYRVILPAK